MCDERAAHFEPVHPARVPYKRPYDAQIAVRSLACRCLSVPLRLARRRGWTRCLEALAGRCNRACACDARRVDGSLGAHGRCIRCALTRPSPAGALPAARAAAHTQPLWPRDEPTSPCRVRAGEQPPRLPISSSWLRAQPVGARLWRRLPSGQRLEWRLNCARRTRCPCDAWPETCPLRATTTRTSRFWRARASRG